MKNKIIVITLLLISLGLTVFNIVSLIIPLVMVSTPTTITTGEDIEATYIEPIDVSDITAHQEIEDLDKSSYKNTASYIHEDLYNAIIADNGGAALYSNDKKQGDAIDNSAYENSANTYYLDHTIMNDNGDDSAIVYGTEILGLPFMLGNIVQYYPVEYGNDNPTVTAYVRESTDYATLKEHRLATLISLQFDDYVNDGKYIPIGTEYTLNEGLPEFDKARDEYRRGFLNDGVEREFPLKEDSELIDWLKVNDLPEDLNAPIYGDNGEIIGYATYGETNRWPSIEDIDYSINPSYQIIWDDALLVGDYAGYSITWYDRYQKSYFNKSFFNYNDTIIEIDIRDCSEPDYFIDYINDIITNAITVIT